MNRNCLLLVTLFEKSAVRCVGYGERHESVERGGTSPLVLQ